MFAIRWCARFPGPTHPPVQAKPGFKTTSIPYQSSQLSGFPTALTLVGGSLMCVASVVPVAVHSRSLACPVCVCLSLSRARAFSLCLCVSLSMDLPLSLYGSAPVSPVTRTAHGFFGARLLGCWFLLYLLFHLWLAGRIAIENQLSLWFINCRQAVVAQLPTRDSDGDLYTFQGVGSLVLDVWDSSYLIAETG